jgi:hypothetical protein
VTAVALSLDEALCERGHAAGTRLRVAAP